MNIETSTTNVLNALSYSETAAIGMLFKNGFENEQIVTASRVCDDAKVTRSVMVNTFSKLECAGILTTQSLGMKGTYVKVKNSEALTMILKKANA